MVGSKQLQNARKKLTATIMSAHQFITDKRFDDAWQKLAEFPS